MAFIFNSLASAIWLTLKGEAFLHLKATRIKNGDTICMRNMQDDFLYSYRVAIIERNEASLELIDSENKRIAPNKTINLIWCAIEPKILEKTLPPLNELGVAKISIVMCTRSQGSWRYDEDRIRRIIISSCEQSGRSVPMEVKFIKSIPKEPFYLIDFCGQNLPNELPNGNYIIGPEGGFNECERQELLSQAIKTYRFNEPFILRSETAAIAIAARSLL